MKHRARFVLVLVVVLDFTPAFAAEQWQSLFNGHDLTGWRANVEPGSFTVVNGTIRANATTNSSHLFYVGDRKDGTETFKNFEFEATTRCDGEANSGVYFHSDIASGKGPKVHLSKGYEVQLNNTAKEKKKTGSLYAVVDLAASPVDETQWFKLRFRVEGKHIQIWINDQQTVDYTEPADVVRPPERAGRLIDPNGGAIALQAHDPTSVYYFKDLRIRRLP
ncbi:MAG: DUF1080 domain-containing protein [Verrucomicrobia bacterium]|nr:DUF1080 domain-containing protein [Verrucomicrobiota bacterium]